MIEGGQATLHSLTLTSGLTPAPNKRINDFAITSSKPTSWATFIHNTLSEIGLRGCSEKLIYSTFMLMSSKG